MTGWGQEQDKQKATAAGFDLHFTKPADPGELKKLLDDRARARSMTN
jgi:CheY-like chemotaxis protein